MATNRVINGVTYVIPDQNDNFLWGTGLSGWVGAVTNGALFKSGGTFTLTSDVNFGTSFGLISLYYKSASANLANSGNVRLSNSDTIVWAGTSGGLDVGLTEGGNKVESNTGFSAGNSKITNLATPTLGTDAVTKAYVDAGTANTANIINILNYGADPTGVLDSTAAIQHAANDAGNSSTYIYAPRGTYKISSTIQNYVANWLGLIGESLGATIFNGASLTTNAFTITNAAVGFTAGAHTVQGPGQSGNLVSGWAFVSQGTGIADALNLYDIEAVGFADTSFFFNNPITSTFHRLRAQNWGQYGFRVVPHSGGIDGGTSTSWVNCYANGGLAANSGAGYYMNAHTYFTMTGCACDSTANSYYFKGTSGGAIIGCGNEANITTANSKGISVTFDGTSAMTLISHRTYNLPSTDSIMVNLLGADKTTLIDCVYTPNGVAPNNEVVVNAGSDNEIRNTRSSGKTGNRATVSDAGANTFVSWGTQVFSQLGLNTTAANLDPQIIFANTQQSPAGNQTGYVIRRLSSLGGNGSLIIGNTNGGELVVVQDNSNVGTPTFVQFIDPLNSTNGRIAFGTAGSTLDYNGFNPGYFTFSKPLAKLNVGSSIVGATVGAANLQGTVQTTPIGGLLQILAPTANVAQVATVGCNISSNNATAAVAQTYYVGINQASGNFIVYNALTTNTCISIANNANVTIFGANTTISGTIAATQSPLNNTQTQVVTGLSSRLTANTSRFNTAVMANEANLTITLNETGTYALMGWFTFTPSGNANGSAGINIDLAGGSATINALAISGTGFIAGSATATPTQFSSSGGAIGPADFPISNAANDWVSLCGTVTVNSAGTFIPRYSQHFASVNATVLLTGSWMQLTKIS